jgi:[acyl-carrier-protein] S-malonyltransferase
MATSDVTSFTEFGPGKVLTGLVRRLTPGAAIANIGSMADIKN